MLKDARTRNGLLACGLLIIGAAIANAPSGSLAQEKAKQPAGPKALPLDEAYAKARVGGKYKMLIGQIKLASDYQTYKDFHESGLMQQPRYGGQTNVPAGYWVYVYPYWYIWRDLAATVSAKEPWSAEQVTGPPDTNAAGDFATAWASLTPDGGDEWLLLEYDSVITPKAVRIHENWNPGAVYRIMAYKLDGQEVEVWADKDPTPISSARGVSVIPLEMDFKIARIRIILDSRSVTGWNEIDAVGLDDAKGKTHWASAAIASSTNAPPDRRLLLNSLLISQERIRRLELEVNQLKTTLAESKGAKKEE